MPVDPPDGVVHPRATGLAPESASILDALLASEGRLAVVLERLHDLVLYETGGGREFISHNVVHLLGYSAEELTADRNFFPALIHPEDAQSEQARVKRWHEQGSVGVLMSRFRVCRKDGEWIWVEDRMVRVTPERGPSFMSGVLMDVTQQREAEEQMRAREDRSKALLAALPDCIFLMDRDGTYLDYHAPPGARLAAPPEEFLGRRMAEVMRGSDVASHQRLLQRTLDERTMHIYEYETGPSNERRHYEVRMVPCGRDRVLSIVREITTRKRAEQAHRQSVERQRLMLNELDHRIRNNLAALISLIDLTAQDDGQTVASFALALRSRVAAMGAVHSLLSRVHWSPVRLSDVIRSTIPADLAPRVTCSGPDLRIAARQTIPLAMAIQELLFNSIKYGSLSSPEGGVNLHWHARDEQSSGGAVAVEMRWREHGGPPPATPPRLGGGTSLLTGLVSSELNGRVNLSYPQTGADHLLTILFERD